MRLPALARALLVLAGVALALVAWGAARAALAPDDGAKTLLADALASAAFLALLALGGALLSREPPAARLGLRRGCFGAGALALGALGLLGLSHAIEGALTVADAPPSATLARFADSLARATRGELALAVAVFAIASAGAEELLFRGLIQRGLERRLGGTAAILVAALAFGAAHGDLVHGAAALPLGIYLGVLARLDGSIRSALAAHALNNAVAVLEAGLAIRVEGPAAALASIGVGLAVAAAALRGVRGRPGPPAPPAGSPLEPLPRPADRTAGSEACEAAEER